MIFCVPPFAVFVLSKVCIPNLIKTERNEAGSIAILASLNPSHGHAAHRRHQPRRPDSTAIRASPRILGPDSITAAYP